MIQLTHHERLNKSLVRCYSIARKILDVWTTPQQPMRLVRQDECPKLLELGLPFLQGVYEVIGDELVPPHQGDLESVEIW